MRELILVLASVWLASASEADLPPTCSRPVYCDSKLLHYVQMARIFNDSKTFVDLQMNFEENKTLTDFDTLLNDTDQNPSRDQLTDFVEKYFSHENEIEDWEPTDYSTDPEFAYTIKDKSLREYGRAINDFWPRLSRKVKPIVREKPEHFSLIPLPNGFIIPGGRFKEVYYWDTYWIIEGLLISGMAETAKGMIENLIALLDIFGHIPNGSRWYYQERSQPPMLTAMVALYHKFTGDTEFVKANLPSLEKEMDYWLSTQVVSVEKNGKNYTLLRYYAPSRGPRPESYYEDYNITENFSEEARLAFYIDTKSAAESGWDFSTRWYIVSDGTNNGTLSDIHTRYIVPVDLNSIFAGALQNIAKFHAKFSNLRKAMRYAELAAQFRDSIEKVLWDDEDGVWYDYDIRYGRLRKYFYSSNVAPLWQLAVNMDHLKANGPRVMKYLQKSGGLDFPGGVPTSLIRSGEQWDFPNVWPPEVSIVVGALENIGTDESHKLAFEVAQTFVRSSHLAFLEYNQMFEKYDAERPGKYGGGGEYNVQFGFGWTNGAVIEFLAKYGRFLTADDSVVDNSTSTLTTPDPSSNSA